ncbi:unnamed protein product [Brachionus calyciflorus]|uniref:Zinc transporter ZIP4/12 EF-hand domain-containing protein n=1 Tax=Brachionus calyciflorus TaxID=104777 RepID=A0A814BNC7_9BILA|nr:unnamed protein product [Brachionus calyciflorus]
MNSKFICFWLLLICSNFSYLLSENNSNLTSVDDHEHELHTDLPDPIWFTDQIFAKYSNESFNYTTISQADFEDIMEKLKIKIDDHENDSHQEEDHDHDHDHRIATVKSESFSKCYGSEEIFTIYHLHDESERISKSLFQSMSPALIWLSINTECLKGEANENHGQDKKTCETTALASK